jgi:hypothetical protein
MKTTDLGNKPFGTRIQLTKSGDFFEIYIPPIGFHPIVLFIAPFAVFWNGFIAVWTLMAAQIPFPANIFAMAFSIPFWSAGGFLAYICLFTLFGKTYFRIDRHEVSLVKTLFGQKISREPAEPKREITRLILRANIPVRIIMRTHWLRSRLKSGQNRFKLADLKVESRAKQRWNGWLLKLANGWINR